MAKEEKCSNCHYEKNNECLRYPPTPVPKVSRDGKGVYVDSRFPFVGTYWYCGEWKEAK